jgi:hypothetical protein
LLVVLERVSRWIIGRLLGGTVLTAIVDARVPARVGPALQWRRC